MPCVAATSICRSIIIICSGLNLFFGMTKLLSKPSSFDSLGPKKPGQVKEPVPHIIVQNYAGSTATITIDGEIRCALADQSSCDVIVSRGHHHILASLGSQYAEDDEELPVDMNGGYAWIAECDFTTHGLNCRYPDKGFSKY